MLCLELICLGREMEVLNGLPHIGADLGDGWIY
jgi:hypothetical protein